MTNQVSKGARDAGATAATPELVKSQPVGAVDREWKRQAFLHLKEQNDNGQLLPPKRKKFSRKVREAVAAAYDDRCAACDEPLKPGFHIDHVVEHDLLGGDDLRNLVPLHPECHRPKTSARAPVLAHVHRLAKATFDAPREAVRKLQGKSFDRSKTKGFDGKVRDRKPCGKRFAQEIEEASS